MECRLYQHGAGGTKKAATHMQRKVTRVVRLTALIAIASQSPLAASAICRDRKGCQHDAAAVGKQTACLTCTLRKQLWHVNLL